MSTKDPITEFLKGFALLIVGLVLIVMGVMLFVFLIALVGG